MEPDYICHRQGHGTLSTSFGASGQRPASPRLRARSANCVYVPLGARERPAACGVDGGPDIVPDVGAEGAAKLVVGIGYLEERDAAPVRAAERGTQWA